MSLAEAIATLVRDWWIVAHVMIDPFSTPFIRVFLVGGEQCDLLVDGDQWIVAKVVKREGCFSVFYETVGRVW